MAAKNPSSFLPLAQFQPHSAQTRTYRFSFTSAGQLLQGPNIVVPPGSNVTLHPIASNGAVNSESVAFAESPEEANETIGNVVPAGADVMVPYAIDNLLRLWFKGAEYDGLIIMVQMPAVG